jgi:hypothetical protein
MHAVNIGADVRHKTSKPESRVIGSSNHNFPVLGFTNAYLGSPRVDEDGSTGQILTNRSG